MTVQYDRGIWAQAPSGPPDPLSRPELFSEVLGRRLLAYAVDLCCIVFVWILVWIVFSVLLVMSFGLLWPVLAFASGLIPLAYHTFLLSGPKAATWGMRLFGLELRGWTGDRPGFLQALAQTGLFYVTTGFSGGLILLFVLINRRRRTLHDVLAGTVMVRALPFSRSAPLR